jgi:indolepyruvate ferredoxin oxidoreductase alpha subunit
MGSMNEAKEFTLRVNDVTTSTIKGTDVAERSFKKEIEQLKLGDGQVFEGEGILAVTKALLQSGVSYVGGYEGAPVSHLIDVLSDAGEYLSELGVHVENCANEAGAAAMLSASMNYPMRGAITFKSIVGTNVASDALSNLASPGVMGGAVIILGEDYGEGSSIIQERSHAFAMKSQTWLVDPRPNMQHIVDMVERCFELSEASNTPVMMELRIRACHMTGKFITRNNVRPKISTLDGLERPVFEPNRISLPPATYLQEKLKVDVRWPAAVEFVRTHRLNEMFDGEVGNVGIVMQGGLYNGVIRALQAAQLADEAGVSKIPLYVLNVTYPLVPDEVADFCKGKDHVLMVEEGQPAFLEDAIKARMHECRLPTQIHGKNVFPLAGEYVGSVMLDGITQFVAEALPQSPLSVGIRRSTELIEQTKKQALELLGNPVPARYPTFCTGCPERPVFSAIRLLQQEIGQIHISADVGCHSFGTLEPFFTGNTILGYGMGLASSAGLAPLMQKRIISIGGDGGFWHSGLTTGVASYVFNKGDGVLVLLKNGYASATGHQHIPSTGTNFKSQPVQMDIEAALRGVGVTWIRTVPSYEVGRMLKTLRHAMSDPVQGLKVIIADGECALAKQRRVKPIAAKQLKAGKRVVRTRFGVDEDTCTGDHSCIRLSGCPSLSVKSNPDPLRTDPVVSINNSCIGCGNCGEVAHAAVLCPSFYRAEIVQNPRWTDRLAFRMRTFVIGLLQSMAPASPLVEAA